jgi:hypothetical protein
MKLLTLLEDADGRLYVVPTILAYVFWLSPYSTPTRHTRDKSLAYLLLVDHLMPSSMPTHQAFLSGQLGLHLLLHLCIVCGSMLFCQQVAFRISAVPHTVEIAERCGKDRRSPSSDRSLYIYTLDRVSLSMIWRESSYM